MKDTDIQQLLYLRSLGYSYGAIGRVLHIHKDTLKSYCRSRGITYNGVPKTKAENAKLTNCKCCDKPLVPNTKGPAREFCDHNCLKRYYRNFPNTSLNNLTNDPPQVANLVSDKGLDFFVRKSDEWTNPNKEVHRDE